MLARDTATGRFRQRFTFALPTSGLADGIRWPSNTALTLSFPTFDYDARAAGAPESVTLANSGSNGVCVTFPVARTLLRVKIAGVPAAATIEARRVDGNVITGDAFAQASHGSTGALLNVVDRQLVLRQTSVPPVALRATHVESVMVRSVAANVRIGVVLPAPCSRTRPARRTWARRSPHFSRGPPTGWPMRSGARCCRRRCR